MITFILLLLFVSRDIDGHPRDIPDAGAYEYREETALLDTDHYIFKNWLQSTGKGDFNRDEITNLSDYAILTDWWLNKK